MGQDGAGQIGETKNADAKQQILLVVDGRPMRQFYTSVFLQRMKYHVVMAKTSEDALVFLDLTVPLVIIANIDLQQMSGLDLLKRVKHDRRTRDVPFIIYTSNRDPEIQKACEAAGSAAYLRHPCSLDQLYTTVQAATEARPRRFVRLSTFLDVIVGDEPSPGGTVREDHITALSELGMFVSSNEMLPYGSVHPFTFFLPNAPGWVTRIEGQVLYRHLSKDMRKQPGMGVKFLKISDQDREFIREFIRQELMQGIAPE